MLCRIDESPQGAGDGISDAEGGSVYGVVVRWRQGEMKPEESNSGDGEKLVENCLRKFCRRRRRRTVLCRQRDDFAR